MRRSARLGNLNSAFLWGGFGAALVLFASTAVLAAGKHDHGSRSSHGRATQVQLPSTLEDFFEPGTQENMLNDEMVSVWSCLNCHELGEDDGNTKQVVGPFDNWAMSMMAQAARDPIWHAALAIANQDANFAGDTCIRCHSPSAWVSGRSVPTDTSAFIASDWDGVNCNFCHRMVDPIASSNNPPEDGAILQALASAGLMPAMPGNARYIVDPDDTRRGPLDDVPENYHGVPILVSPFHREGQMCGTCHDVSNAMYTRQSDGTYALNTFDASHPTLHPHDMMPEQRTYSEWLNSTFASSGVYFPDHRFGGDHPTGVMSSCQDCHMPKNFGGACVFWPYPPFFPRPDVPEHSFIGANTWVLGAVYDLHGSSGSFLTPESVDLNSARTQTMLRNASDMQVVQYGGQLKVRVINYSGHKLPTGYPEGRRMWINVKFFNAAGDLIDERGGYDYTSASLNAGDTKVYEMKLGMTPEVASSVGLPAGQSFHLVLNNTILKDNRIPPIGFANAAFEAVRAQPVAHTYADGQYWDDTPFAIPAKAAQAVVTLYYQTTSREYIEFLRDTNVTNNAGQIAHDAWVNRGKSAPQDMDVLQIALAAPRTGDITHDGVVNVSDLLAVISAWGPCPPPNLCAADLNGDGAVNVSDLLLVISNWG